MPAIKIGTARRIKMYGLKFLISGDALRQIKQKMMTIAASNKIWRTKNPKFFHCDVLPRQTVSSATLDF